MIFKIISVTLVVSLAILNGQLLVDGIKYGLTRIKEEES